MQRSDEKLRIWSPSLRLDVSEWLLSSGYAAQVKAQRRPHPAGGVEETLGNCRRVGGEGSVVEYLGVFEPKRMIIDYWDLCIASSVTEGMRKLLERSHIRADGTKSMFASKI